MEKIDKSVLTISLDQQELTEQEAHEAVRFTTAQVKFLSNMLAQTAQEKINLPVNVANPLAFAYDQEFLRGRLSALQEILVQVVPA